MHEKKSLSLYDCTRKQKKIVCVMNMFRAIRFIPEYTPAKNGYTI